VTAGAGERFDPFLGDPGGLAGYPYADLTRTCPVPYNEKGTPILLTMDDILFVKKHRSVEQASKFLGSNRPAIPLGLDGPEHTKYRRLLDPVFTAKMVAPLADQVRRLANEMIDGFFDRHEVDVYHDWCEPLPSQTFLSIMGLPMEDLPGFLNFKELTLGNEQLERDPLMSRPPRRQKRCAGSRTTSTGHWTSERLETIPAMTCWAGCSRRKAAGRS
jgi:cytochrome P450